MNDEDYATILQVEENELAKRSRISMPKENYQSRLACSGPLMRQDYVCIDDEIITLDDDDDDDAPSVVEDSLSNKSIRTGSQDDNKGDLIRRDEILARQLQEELDKEMAETIQKNQNRSRRPRRDDIFDPNDFLLNTEITMPDSLDPSSNLVYMARSRASNPSITDEISRSSVRNNSTASVNASFQPPRRVATEVTGTNRSNRRPTASAPDRDYRQTSLNTFLNRQNSDLISSGREGGGGSLRRDNTQRLRTPVYNTTSSDYFDYLSRLMPSSHPISSDNFIDIGLNLDDDILLPNYRRFNRRPNQLHVFNQFNRNSNDFTSDDYEELLRLDEMNVKRGLTKEEFESLPKFDYKSSNEIDGNESDRTCSICQDEFENKAKLTALTCTHKFHCKCIKEWLKQSRRCPLCTKDAINGN